MCLNDLPTPLEGRDMTNINTAGTSRASSEELTCAENKKAKGKSTEVRVIQNLSAVSTIVGTRCLFKLLAPELFYLILAHLYIKCE